MRLFLEILFSALALVGTYCTVGAILDAFSSSMRPASAILIADEDTRARLETFLQSANAFCRFGGATHMIVLFDRSLLGEDGMPTAQETALLACFEADYYIIDRN